MYLFLKIVYNIENNIKYFYFNSETKEYLLSNTNPYTHPNQILSNVDRYNVWYRYCHRYEYKYLDDYEILTPIEIEKGITNSGYILKKY
jgi:hypothetical protein